MEEKECSMIRRIDADKTQLHLSTANRRLLIAFIVSMVCVVVGFVLAIQIFTEANTKREAKILELMAHLHGVELTDGLQQGTD